MNNNIYPEGTIVYAREKPGLKLIIRRFVDRIYYCKMVDDPGTRDLVYFERELTNNPG